MKTIAKAPDLGFNPLSMEMITYGDVSQLKLKPVNRYFNIDSSNKVINFYIDLTDGKNVITLPCKYYIWLASEHTPFIICNQTRLTCGNNKYLNLEVADMLGVKLEISNMVDNPLSEGGHTIPTTYRELFWLENTATRIVNCYRAGVVMGVCTGYLGNKNYVRGLCPIETLQRQGQIYLAHRKLLVNNVEYVVDLEGANRL